MASQSRPRSWFQWSLRTFRYSFSIGHVHGRLEGTRPPQPRVGDEAWRDGDDVAVPREVAAPPMGAQKLHKFALAVHWHVILAGAGLEVLLQDA